MILLRNDSNVSTFFLCYYKSITQIERKYVKLDLNLYPRVHKVGIYIYIYCI